MSKPKFNKKTNRWTVSLFATLPDRSAFRRNKSFREKAEALAWQKKQLPIIEAMKSSPVEQKKLLSEAVEQWLNYCARHSESTRAEYKRKMNLFVEFLPQEITLCSQIQLRHITDYVTYLLNKHSKRSTINTQINQLKSFFSYLEENFDIENPSRKWKPLKVRQEKVNCPTKEQFQLLVDNIKPELRPIIRFIGNTGLRSGELLNLNWSNVDEGGKSITFTGKGNKQRTVPLNSAAQDILEKLRPEKVNGNPIFINLSNSRKPLKSRALYYEIRKTFRHCTDFPGAGLHSIRHFFATSLLLKGVPIIMVSRILGHSSISVTQTHYSHILPENLSGTCDCLDF